MEFIVPQFIEKEAKILGPLTFSQLIFIGTAGGVCLLLFFILPFSLFVIISIVLMGGSSALAFLKIEKIPLPVYIKNFFFFLSRPKIYLWKRGAGQPNFVPAPPKNKSPVILKSKLPIIGRLDKKEKEDTEKKETPKIERPSRLNELSIKLGGK